jgi:hypothetical protein
MARLGSFGAPVDLPEQLRPWVYAGVEALFLPGGLPAPAAPPPVAAPASPSQSGADTTVIAEPPLGEAAVAWPEPWATLAGRVRIRPRVIITYADLYADMTGSADPARRKLFHTILSYLAWPPGTTLFWPVSMDRSPDEVGFFAADVFARGVAHFNVEHIAAFGQKPAERAATLFPQDGPKPAVMVHQLPEPEAMVGLLPHELHQGLAVLKALVFK